MFLKFQQIYNAALQNEMDNPLQEMLAMLDTLSNGAVGQLEQMLPDETMLALPQRLEKRQQGIPWPYILGQASFMGLSLNCSPAALIPRAETELLAKTVLALLAAEAKENPLVIDMGTGSGNIAVSLAYHAPQAHILASDVSPEAVALAQTNVDKYALHQRVSLFCGDLFIPLQNLGYEGAVDIVICNPPYIPTSSLDKLAPEIINHEPRVALDAGQYGINIYRRLVSDALRFLKPGGILAFEIGAGQEKIAARLLQKAGGYERITTVVDDDEVIRVITAVARAAV